MKALFRIFFATHVVAIMTYYKRTNTIEIIVVLIFFVCVAYNSKFRANLFSITAMSAVCAYLCGVSQIYYMLYILIIFDIMLCGIYYMLIIPFISIFFVIPLFTPELIKDIVILIAGALAGYGLNAHDKKETQLYDLIYEEKNSRYKMEKQQSNLAVIKGELQRSTMLLERNRIARDIHDNAGHKLAGSIIQIRAARKILDTDILKSKSMLDEGITHLSSAMDLLRETVHNLKPVKGIGLDEINELIDEFKFCAIELSTMGDFNDEEPFLMRILARNLKEALTNVSKHSNAAKVTVRIETNPLYLRMTVKDNGSKNIENIKEGLGLSGMRERLKNVGGTFSYGYSDGFVQASFIPKELTDT